MQRLGFALALFLGVDATPSTGQDQASSSELINLFFDCPTAGCGDLDYLRREVPFVNWMRDRADADVHVLVTSQVAGGGGRVYTVAFLGLRAFAGDDQELTYSTQGDATQDEQRTRLVDRLRLGLVRYVQGTPAAAEIRVSYGQEAGPAPVEGAPSPAGTTPPPTPQSD